MPKGGKRGSPVRTATCCTRRPKAAGSDAAMCPKSSLQSRVMATMSSQYPQHESKVYCPLYSTAHCTHIHVGLYVIAMAIAGSNSRLTLARVINFSSIRLTFRGGIKGTHLAHHMLNTLFHNCHDRVPPPYLNFALICMRQLLFSSADYYCLLLIVHLTYFSLILGMLF